MYSAVVGSSILQCFAIGALNLCQLSIGLCIGFSATYVHQVEVKQDLADFIPWIGNH